MIENSLSNSSVAGLQNSDRIFDYAESGIKIVYKSAKTVDDIISFINSHSILFQDFIKISDSFLKRIRSIRVARLLVIPFRMKKIVQHICQVSTTKKIKVIFQSFLKILHEGFRALGDLISTLKVFQSLKVITFLSKSPLLNLVFLPAMVISTGLEAWKLCSVGRIFSIIKSGSESKRTRKSALNQLYKLQKQDINDMKKELGLSKSCALSEKIESLIKNLKKNKRGSLADTEEFYSKMKERVSIKLGINIAKTILNASLLFGSILLIALPCLPMIGGSIYGVSATVLGVLDTSESLFMKDDIIDPGAQTMAQKIMSKVHEIGSETFKYLGLGAEKLIALGSMAYRMTYQAA